MKATKRHATLDAPTSQNAIDDDDDGNDDDNDDDDDDNEALVVEIHPFDAKTHNSEMQKKE